MLGRCSLWLLVLYGYYLVWPEGVDLLYVPAHAYSTLLPRKTSRLTNRGDSAFVDMPRVDGKRS